MCIRDSIYTLPEPTTAELLVDKSFVTAEGEAFNFGENIFSFTVDPVSYTHLDVYKRQV